MLPLRGCPTPEESLHPLKGGILCVAVAVTPNVRIKSVYIFPKVALQEVIFLDWNTFKSPPMLEWKCIVRNRAEALLLLA